MTKIELSPFDQKDILELLDYAKNQKIHNRPTLKGTQKWDDTNYWIERIEYLKKVINGKVRQPNIYKSTLEYLEKIKDE